MTKSKPLRSRLLIYGGVLAGLFLLYIGLLALLNAPGRPTYQLLPKISTEDTFAKYFPYTWEQEGTKMAPLRWDTLKSGNHILLVYFGENEEPVISVDESDPADHLLHSGAAVQGGRLAAYKVQGSCVIEIKGIMHRFDFEDLPSPREIGIDTSGFGYKVYFLGKNEGYL